MFQKIDIEVLCFSLVHWMCFSGPGSELDMVRYQIMKEGYLDCKSKYLGMVSHWETNYFALTGRGLFHYARQGDKEPKMIYELSASNCGGCRRVSDEEQRFAFEVSEMTSPFVEKLGGENRNLCKEKNMLPNIYLNFTFTII